MDAHKNFAYSLVATAPSPATSGTSLVVTGGTGALFPAVPFNATIWPIGVQPTSANAEIVRVTGRSTDTLTIVRAQEGSSARTIVIGDQIAATITVKTVTDLEDVSNSSGSGSPEGVVTRSPGARYLDTSVDPPDDWGKISGSGNTGWRQLAG
jgi:hypothetical protein